MRITRIDVKDWRILKNPRAEFRTSCAVIIGENGSGKSTIIELILSVFEFVFKRQKDPKAISDVDGFYLEYQTTDGDDKEHLVVFESGYFEESKPSELNIIIDGEPYYIKEDSGERLKSYLPANIIAYYAGTTERVKAICNYFIKEKLDAIRKSGNEFTLTPLNLPTDTPFIYSDQFHLPIALTSLLMNGTKSYTLEKLNFKVETANVIVNLKRPHWATKGSDEFWGNTSQLFNDFLSGLIGHAISTDQDDDYIEIGVSAMNLRDYLDEMEIEHKGVFLFQIFDLLHNNGLLDWVDVKWINQDSQPISIGFFSEGEKQVIMTSALIEFWDKKHCLFLFDEPDTFLHPKWQSRFLPEIKEKLHDSQAIITTHSPLMLSSMTDGTELFVMKAGRLMTFSEPTYGMEASDIIETAMETPARDNNVAALLEATEKDITKHKLEDAKAKLLILENSGVDRYDLNRLRSTIERFELLGI